MVDSEIRFLIAEDERPVREFLHSVLKERSFDDVHVAVDGQEALEKLESLEPDVLITDLVMPRLNGEELAGRALDMWPDLTVMVTTGNGTIETAVNLLKRGVFDFITKPFTLETLQASIERGVERARGVLELNGVREVIEALMVALESKDAYLRGHGKRVSMMSRRLAGLVGWTKQRVRVLEYAALVHDVGKIGIPESILNKPGPLTEEEMEVIKRHPIYSREILQPVRYLQDALPFVYHHHERYDGRGYPDGIAGEDIPEGARIISVCDTYDAMNSVRAYRPVIPEDRILEVLSAERNKQLDGRFVNVFLEHLDEIRVVVSQEPSEEFCV